MGAGASDGNEEETEAFTFGRAGVADVGEVLGKSQEVVVSFSFAPSGVVGADEENVFKFEAFGLVSGHNRDGICGIGIGTVVCQGHTGGFVIVGEGDKVF